MKTRREILSRVGKKNTIDNLAEEWNMRKSILLRYGKLDFSL